MAYYEKIEYLGAAGKRQIHTKCKEIKEISKIENKKFLKYKAEREKS